ncbi:hypothetical protein MMC25_001445 [Agyrium rufum]|nr:hypothetical protein [Agyrium rufum]
MLLSVNFHGVFIGAGLTVNDKYDNVDLALIQVAAKIQEMLCIASLSTILLHILREDLLHGKGTLFGLVSSHLWFANPNSLLLPEYLAAAQDSLWDLLRSVRYIFVALAALIGPFAAVLMIPTLQSFPAGGVSYYMAATADELLPDTVDSTMELEACKWLNATIYPVCPCGGYGSLHDRSGLTRNYDAGGEFQPAIRADSSISSPNYLTIDTAGIMPAMISSGFDQPYESISSTYICQPNALTVITQQTLMRDWYSATKTPNEAKDTLFPYLSNFQFASAVTATSVSMFPRTYVHCTAARNLTREDTVVGFGYIDPQQLAPWGWAPLVDIRPVDISHLDRDSSSHVRTQWVSLPEEESKPVSTGLLFELPWSQPSNSRVVAACSVVASWTPRGKYHKVKSHDDPTSIPSNLLVRSFIQPIKLTPDWLDLLTSVAPDPPVVTDSWRPSTLENLFVAAGFDTLTQDLRSYPYYASSPSGHGCSFGNLNANLTDLELWNWPLCNVANYTNFIQLTLARLISDGLSRRLSWRAYESRPPLAQWFSNNIGRNAPNGKDTYGRRILRGRENAVNLTGRSPGQIVQRIDFAVQGLRYRISSATDYLAVLVAVTYLLLSSAHVLYALKHRVTSSSWDTVSELMLLTFNSPPVPAFHGTLAQIGRWRTYKKKLRIRAQERTSTSSTQQAVYLQLLVDGQDSAEELDDQSSLGTDTQDSVEPKDPADQIAATVDATVKQLQVPGSPVQLANQVRYHQVEVGKEYL